MRGFASDNNSGVHPVLLEAIAKVNEGHTPGYGNDEVTARALKKFKEHFGNDIEVFYVFNGTAGNVLGLQALTQPFNSIICCETAHLNVDECGAPERFLGCKLIKVPSPDGKLRVSDIEKCLVRLGDPHSSQPKVISITQPTEVGTVYSIEEMKQLSDFAHKNNLYLHVDGARFINAAASLNCNLKQISTDVGIDVLTFGGTKNGLLFGEAIIFFKPELARNFQYVRKQGMQLASKMRFVAAQFEALLSNDLWLKISKHNNEMAKLLEKSLEGIPRLTITQKVQANAVFAKIPKEKLSVLREKYFFYVWDEKTYEVRWMMTYDTTPEDVLSFAEHIRKNLKD